MCDIGAGCDDDDSEGGGGIEFIQALSDRGEHTSA